MRLDGSVSRVQRMISISQFNKPGSKVRVAAGAAGLMSSKALSDRGAKHSSPLMHHVKHVMALHMGCSWAAFHSSNAQYGAIGVTTAEPS